MSKHTMITSAAILTLAAGALAARDPASTDDGDAVLQDANSQQDDALDACAADVDDDNMIGVNELTRIFTSWGLSCAEGCGAAAGDYNGDGTVDVMDLILVVTNWGLCEAADEPEAEPKSDQFADDFGDGSEQDLDDYNSQPLPGSDSTDDDMNPHGGAGDTIGDANDDGAEPDPWSDFTGDAINPLRATPGPIPGQAGPADPPYEGGVAG